MSFRSGIVAAAALAACVAVHLAGGAASGVVVCDDPNGPNHLVTPPSDYDGVPFLDSAYGTSGVLINPWYVLTAAHAVRYATTSNLIEFHLAGGVQQFTLAEKWLLDPSVDLAVVRLNRSTGMAGYPLYNPAPGAQGSEVGKTATLVGYGMSGTPKTVLDGGDPNYPRGTLRVGYNTVDAVEASYYSYGQCLQTDFDDPNIGGLGADKEAMVAMGDSGGPMFIKVGQQLYVAGIAVTVWPRHDLNHWPGYGDVGHHVRVGAYLDWINAHLFEQPTNTGDFNHDGNANATDVDSLFSHFGGVDMWYDLTSDDVVGKADSDRLVRALLNTEYGDANLDHLVDINDYNALAGNFGLTGSGGWALGDFNGDKNVNFADYQILEAYYGFGSGSPPPPLPPIPEPATASMIACGLAILAGRKRR